MTNDQSPIIYFTPYYYVLKQFSRSMRPGDTVLGVQSPSTIDHLQSTISLCATTDDKGNISVNILNTGEATSVPLQIGAYHASVPMPANSVQTLIVNM